MDEHGLDHIGGLSEPRPAAMICPQQTLKGFLLSKAVEVRTADRETASYNESSTTKTIL